jgi:hypothetical protein
MRVTQHVSMSNTFDSRHSRVTSTLLGMGIDRNGIDHLLDSILDTMHCLCILRRGSGSARSEP